MRKEEKRIEDEQKIKERQESNKKEKEHPVTAIDEKGNLIGDRDTLEMKDAEYENLIKQEIRKKIIKESIGIRTKKKIKIR
ncbi:MAG: hypothetical protein R2750_06150 [Bacteroidales bacterium]